MHIGNIAAEANECFAVEGFEALDISEASEGAIGGEVVGSDDDACTVLDGED